MYDRGVVPSRARPKSHVLALSERAPFDIDSLKGLVERASSAGRGVLVALVDEEGDLTYYEASLLQPSGELKDEPAPRKGRALVLNERVLVFDQELAEALRVRSWGRPMGGALQLSLIEAACLAEDGALELYSAASGRRVTLAGLIKKARAQQRDFGLHLRVYRNLRKLGLVPRTGFKYGTHFRVYDRDPEGTHARYLLHALPRGFVGTWPELGRAVRLAHGVRKELIVARVGPGNEVDYLKLGRMKP